MWVLRKYLLCGKRVVVWTSVRRRARKVVAVKCAAEDVMGEISIDDITKNIPKAAGEVEFDSAGRGNKPVKKTKEHLEAEKKLRGKAGEELNVSKRELAKPRRKYRAIRIIQEMQKVKNKHAGCQALYFEKKEEQQVTGNSGRRSWKDTRGTSIRMRR